MECHLFIKYLIPMTVLKNDDASKKSRDLGHYFGIF